MDKHSQSEDQPLSVGERIPVSLGQTEVQMLVVRRDGGGLDRCRRVLATVGQRVGDVDGGTLMHHWAALGYLSPVGLAPVVLIQQEWPGRLLPIPSDWLPQSRQASKRFFPAEPVAPESLSGLVKGQGNGWVPQWEYFHRGALVIFTPWLVDVAAERELSWQMARWLAAMWVEAAGDEDAARCFEQRWDEGQWQISRHGRQCWNALETRLGARDSAYRRTMTWLFAHECFLNLAHQWAGQPFEGQSRSRT